MFYLLLTSIISLSLLLKTNLHPARFFERPLSALLVTGAFSRNALFTYTLFWTLFLTLC